MGIKTIIGLLDQFPVKAFFAGTRFIARHEQDRLTLRIESEGHSPFAIGRAETQLLHVRVARSIQRINTGPPCLRSELLKKSRQCQNLRPHVLVQHVELQLKLVADLNNPTHTYNMA